VLLLLLLCAGNPDSIPAIYCDLDGWAMTVTPPEADCDRPE
jgi:hypothetical protein